MDDFSTLINYSEQIYGLNNPKTAEFTDVCPFSKSFNLIIKYFH